MRKQFHISHFTLVNYLLFANEQLEMFNNLLNAKCEMNNKTAKQA